jgi:anti-sigma factor (TIGR02949 family)
MTQPHPADPIASTSCADALNRLYEFLDGELTPDVDERIREHLAACRSCFPAFEHERVFLRFCAGEFSRR